MDQSTQSPLVVGLKYNMRITSVNSATNFGVQLKDWASTIDFIQAQCQKCGPEATPLPAEDLHEGKLCMARFEVDNNWYWYRAFILEVHEDLGLATVYFADYGNVDDCDIKEDMRECPLSVSKIPPQVIECQWVNANPSGTGMQNIISKLDDLLASETYVDGTVVRIVDNQGWLLNQAGGDGPVVLSIPELEGGDSQLQVNDANADKPGAVIVANVQGVHAAAGVKPEVDKEETAPMNGAAVGFQGADGVDGAEHGHQILAFQPSGIDLSSSPSPGVLLACVDEFIREFTLLRQQILDLEKSPGPTVREMTPAEIVAAARAEECKAEIAQHDEKINSLLELLSVKELAIQKADEDFINETKQLETAIRAKQEELVEFRAQAKLRCAFLQATASD